MDTPKRCIFSLLLAGSTWLPAGAQQAAAVQDPGPPATVQRALLPGVLADDSRFADGCWVRFYDRAGYGGEQLLVVGPLDVPEMRDTGEPLRDWDSAVVGPRALVMMYEGKDFLRPAATLRPGQRIESLTSETRRVADIRSVRVNCSLG